MKKDLDKILSRTLLTYTFLLFIVLILKIAGFDYFGLDINNPVILSINNFATRFHLVNIWYFITLTVYSYVIISIASNNTNKKVLIVSILISFIDIISMLTIKKEFSQIIIVFYDFILLFIGTMLCKNDKLKNIVIRFTIISFINILYQLLSATIRSVNMAEVNRDDFVFGVLVNIDYIIMMLITHKLYFLKGSVKKCGEAGLFLDLPTLLKTQLKKFPTKFLKTKNKVVFASNKEKFETSLYLFLFLLWNIFTVFVVLFVAKLNNGLPECIFILLSFWMNKRVFGKAFHMKKASYCFIVSNLVYYVLVRICISINISLLFPIILGVLLSYFTSLLVKYNEFKLYRGMPKDDLIAHCKICNLNKYDTQLMVDYYCERKTDVQIAMKNNYSVEAIKKQKKKVRDILNNH